jgi:hypothetical protein
MVFLDDTWCRTDMARRSGRARRGQKAVAAVPHGHWKTSTFVAGLRTDGIVAPMVFDGAMNGAIFRQYVETQLGPALRPGDVVVMDNLAAHKSAASAPPSRRAAPRRCCRGWSATARRCGCC